MYKFSCLLVLASLFIFSSCKKFSDTEAINSSVKENSTSTYQNPFGVYVVKSNGYTMPDSEQVHFANDLGVAYARLTIENDQWNNANERKSFLKTYTAYTTGVKPMKILLNVSWGDHSTNAVAFPGDTPAYEQFVKDLTDTLTSSKYVKPALIVLENEENNPNYHIIRNTSDQAKYIDMLNFAITECHSKNLKISNAGLTHLGVILLVWDYYKNTLHNKNMASTFLHNCLSDDSYRRFQSSPTYINTNLGIAKYYANAYKTMKLDYMNIHWYEPIKVVYSFQDASVEGLDTIHLNPNCINSVFQYFNDPQTEGGLQLICNEVGQVTESTELPGEIVCVMRNLPFVCYYSGDREEGKSLERPYGQVALHTTLKSGSPRYIIRPNGIDYKDNIAALLANYQTYCTGDSFTQ